ncbi:glycosyltransferase involved in cell wall biosynthesis [Catenuloplanes nepalensis]|uniref:Glycosyltransferase involved in cell wall biosynthesis n=1 Tax=Catenuloplanes nepalensis TaxID=587533 RepID=A0ABT9MSR7_9ACTN|nr:glycosyltransferase family 4 protein [Catenuloplanes nepalensis]MDP9794076.1 glycosyltransferase involved in cell wall biosynthesis [Catenuloplanes nepalensis]
MRILIVSSYFPPHIGGVEAVAHRQARVLAAAGHDVAVATGRFDPALPEYAREHGYALWRLPATNPVERRNGVPYPLMGVGFWRGLRQLVAWSEVVHVHDVLYQPPQAAALLAVRARRPLYATQHVGPATHPHPLVRGVEHTVGTVAGRLIWPRCRTVVAYNPRVVAHLRAGGVAADRIARAEIGVDTDVFAPGPPDAALRREWGLPAGVPIVLFVGRMITNKGYASVLAAAGPGRHVVLAGSGSPAGPVPPGATFLGPVPADRLPGLYRLADVFALPSRGEVFPIVAREAMAAGLPVVLTDSPRYDEYGVDRALLRLIAPEPAPVRAAIDEILADDALRRRMGAYSRALALRLFDAATADDALLRLYDDVPVVPAGGVR